MEQCKKAVYAIFMLKRFLIGFAVLVALLIGAIIVLPGLIPTDTYRSKLEADLSRLLARDVTITGDIKISTIPILEIQTGAISLANPEGFSEPQFIDVGAMSAKVKLLPLLSKRVEISRVTLEAPSIHLEKQTNGRVNWTGNQTKATTETGPFKRDGRFTAYDPALALLRIESGTVRYIDAIRAQDVKVEKINLDLRAPGLNQPLRLNGAFVFDGLDASIATQIESPLNFLKGLETGFSGEIKTSEGDADFSGRFIASEDIALTADFDATTSTPNDLASRLPLPADLTLPSFSKISAKGTVVADPTFTQFSAIEFTAAGAGLEASYRGTLDLAENAKGAGQYTAVLGDMSIIEPYLEGPKQALTLLNSVTSSGDVEWIDGKLSLKNMNFGLLGSDIKTNFQGNADFNETFSLNGTFDGEAANIAELVNKAGHSLPDAAALNRLTAAGRIAFADGTAIISNLAAEASDGLINGNFSGELIFGETLNLNGRFTGEIPDLAELDVALSRDIPYSDVAKQITLSSDIQSQSGNYVLSNLTANLRDGLLNGDFNGQLTLGQFPDISGTLTLSAESLRRIATSQNVALPKSTDVGNIFENFSLSGKVTGTPETMTFENGVINLDNLSGRGDFILSMEGPKPKLVGALALNDLDLRAYMAAWSAQNPTGAILPWSNDPIAISGLEALDAEIDMTTPAIFMDRLELGESVSTVSLQNGTLTADLGKTELYGGDAAGTFSIRSLNGLPTVSIDAKIRSVNALSFFMASGGFEKITGNSDIAVSFTGSGQSQAAIMNSLTGDGVFKVIKGQLLGLNVNDLLTGVEQAITNRALPQGLGLGGTTDFNDINSQFSLKNGRATVSGFQLKSGAFHMDADGSLDIGQQRIDIGIRPKLTGTSNLANFGVPLRFTGGFGQANAKLDTDFLGKIAKAKAQAKAGGLIQDRLGDSPVGNILNSVIGGTAATQPIMPEKPEVEPEIQVPSSPEDAEPRKIELIEPEPEPIPAPEPQAEPKPAPETLEDVGEDLLKNLFGQKKTKENTE